MIYDLSVTSPDKNRKDVKSLKEAVIRAESVAFPNRVQLYDLYHDVVSMDGFLSGIIEKRIASVLNKKLKFIDREGNENREITHLMRGEEGRKLIRLILESLFWGLSGVEFKVGREFALEEIPRKHIKIEQGVIAKNQYNAYDDEFKIDELPFVWVIGEKNHLGLLLTCSLYAVYKRGNWGDWAQYVEIFGQPVRIVEYDAYDTKTKEEIRKLGRESGNGLFMMIPKQAKFSMLDGKQSNGNGDLQDKFKNACNEEMAICILGNPETTSSSRSSGYAQSKEHAEQQDEITASDLVFIENTLNSARFLKILSSYGYPVEGGKFKYNIELNLEKLKKRLEIDLQVSEKVPFDPDYWYETYGIPKPQNPKLHTDREESKEEKKEKETHVLKEKIRELTDFQPLSFKDRVFKKVADFFDHALQK